MAEDQSNNPEDRGERESMDVRRLVSFQIHRLAIASDRHGQKLILEKFGLTLPQWRVVGVIGAIGDDAPIARVLEDLGMNKSQLSRELKALMEKGLVRSATDARDRRRLRATLTPRGRDLQLKIADFVNAQNEIMLSQLSPEAVKALSKNLDTLIRWTEREIKRMEMS